MKASSLFATDFDGTLMRSDGTFSSEDLESLCKLRDLGCAVVLASGRSPFSLERCLSGRKIPVEWYVLSSGAGILNHQGTVQVSHTLSAEETLEVHKAFASLGIEDISIQGPFPDAHRLHWVPGNHGKDFKTRLELYRGYSKEVNSAAISASEVIGFVSPEDSDNVIENLKITLGKRFSIIRATSPIDGHTVWIEVFPEGVSKASGCEFIRRELGIDPEKTSAVGNDWNDLHLLDWAAKPFVVENSPEELKKRYTTVASNDSHGVKSAAEKWLDVIS